MVAEEFIAAYAALEQFAGLGEDGTAFRGIGAVVVEVEEEHGKERDDEEGGVYVGDEIGFGVGVICEDCLFTTLSAFLTLSEIWGVWGNGEDTYRREEVRRCPENYCGQQQYNPDRVPKLRMWFLLAPCADDARGRQYRALDFL
jgi:hypothetical protein